MKARRIKTIAQACQEHITAINRAMAMTGALAADLGGPPKH